MIKAPLISHVTPILTEYPHGWQQIATLNQQHDVGQIMSHPHRSSFKGLPEMGVPRNHPFIWIFHIVPLETS